jgi:hypothetical protein
LPPPVLQQVPLWAGPVLLAFWQEQLWPLEQVLGQFHLLWETANWHRAPQLCKVPLVLVLLVWQKSLLKIVT